MIKLSIILPCYNVAPYVGRCIESIEHQDIPQTEYEVICVDDCSKDNTAEVIKEYQKQYSNIRLICHTENKTAGGARNTGMDAAMGEYLWFVDPDDAIVENILGTLWQQVKEKQVDILFFNYNYIGEDNIVHSVMQFDGNQKVMRGQDFFLTYCKRKRLAEVTSIWREVFSAKYLKENDIRYPEIKSSQDVVFAWHSYLVAQKVSAISTIAYNHVRRPASTTGSKGMYKTANVISAALLYSNEMMQLDSVIVMPQVFHDDLVFEAKDSMNTDSRKVLKMERYEQKIFYQTVGKYSELIDKYKELMNSKTRVIFNYRLPYIVWQVMMWLYSEKDKIKR